MNACEGEHALYASGAQCEEICSLIGEVGPFDDWAAANEGDSVQCRAYHATRPGILDPATHCPHTALYEDSHCGEDVCEVYCDVIEDSCPESYDDRAECLDDCAGLALEHLWPFPLEDGQLAECP